MKNRNSRSGRCFLWINSSTSPLNCHEALLLSPCALNRLGTGQVILDFKRSLERRKGILAYVVLTTSDMLLLPRNRGGVAALVKENQSVVGL